MQYNTCHNIIVWVLSTFFRCTARRWKCATVPVSVCHQVKPYSTHLSTLRFEIFDEKFRYLMIQRKVFSFRNTIVFCYKQWLPGEKTKVETIGFHVSMWCTSVFWMYVKRTRIWVPDRVENGVSTLLKKSSRYCNRRRHIQRRVHVHVRNTWVLADKNVRVFVSIICKLLRARVCVCAGACAFVRTLENSVGRAPHSLTIVRRCFIIVTICGRSRQRAVASARSRVWATHVPNDRLIIIDSFTIPACVIIFVFFFSIPHTGNNIIIS